MQNNFIHRLYNIMFKEIVSAFNKFFNRKELVIAVIVILLLVALVSYSTSKSFSLDGLEDGQQPPSSYSQQTDAAANAVLGNKTQPSVRATSAQNVVGAPEGAIAGNGYQLKPVNNPSDLLPKDANSEWAQLNPSTINAGSTPDLLQAGYHIGLDTIGQTLRNANYQLRSDPIIPKSDVGPWSQSTIEPDLGRVPLELGYGCK
jgi:hypothetical protein